MIRLALLAACVAVSAQTARAAPLSLEDFFRGTLSAQGTIDNLKDGTRRAFTMAMTARWAGPTGTLVEDVSYADGAREHKVWTFSRTAPGRYVGRRDDVTRDADVTEDAEGIRMSYKANTLLPSGSTYNLAFDDRLTATSPSTVQVRSQVTYFLVPVARVSITITRVAP